MAKKLDKTEELPKKIDKKIINELIKIGRERGYLTYDEITQMLPDQALSSEQIDETLMIFDELEIEILTEEKRKVVPKKEKAVDKKKVSKIVEKAVTDFGTVTDPVKMYLREMGLVTLLSREGEIVIAK